MNHLEGILNQLKPYGNDKTDHLLTPDEYPMDWFVKYPQLLGMLDHHGLQIVNQYLDERQRKQAHPTHLVYWREMK